MMCKCFIRRAPAVGNRRHAQLHRPPSGWPSFYFHFKRKNCRHTQATVMASIGYPLAQPIFQGGQEFAALVSLAGGAMSAGRICRCVNFFGRAGWRVVFYLSPPA